jgi:hypothetical protein
MRSETELAEVQVMTLLVMTLRTGAGKHRDRVLFQLTHDITLAEDTRDLALGVDDDHGADFLAVQNPHRFGERRPGLDP